MLGVKTTFDREKFLQGYESLSIVCREPYEVRETVNILMNKYKFTEITSSTNYNIEHCDSQNVNKDRPAVIYYNEVLKRLEVEIEEDYEEYQSDYYFTDITFDDYSSIRVNDKDLLSFLSI